MEDNPIELEYKLKIINSQRDKPIIIQDNKHIFYYSHKRKDDSKYLDFQSIEINKFALLMLYQIKITNLIKQILIYPTQNMMKK